MLLRTDGGNKGRQFTSRWNANNRRLRLPGPGGQGLQKAQTSSRVACTNATSAVAYPKASATSSEGETETFTIEKEGIIYTRRDLLLTTLADSMGEREGVRVTESVTVWFSEWVSE